MKKNKKKHHSSASGSAKGVLEITRSGIGYVLADDGEGDVLVRPQDFNQAFNGDTVTVDITRDAGNGKKREGRIDKVLNRRQTEFIGTLRPQKGQMLFVPGGEKPMPFFELDAPLTQWVEEDQKVVVRFLEWPSKQRRPLGRLIEILEPDAEGDIAMKEILVEKGFSLEFSDDSLETAARLSDTITEDELSYRKDLRDILTFTIDPHDAKDFDDAISYQKLQNGLHEIGVHIADVSHFLEEDTPLDDEAYQRATSVYLPDRVNPMLPERISNELCSLRPHEDKYTFSILFQINDEAEVKSHWIGKTVIHSNHRYTYEDAQEIIKGANGPYQQEIVLINGISQQLRRKRFQHGAINFSSQEVRFKLDEKGKPIGVVIKESFEAHQLIEELMLLANKYIAQRVGQAGTEEKPIPFPYRIHDAPDEEKLVPFIAFARKFGYTFNMSDPNSIAASFNAMLAAARGTPQQHVLEQLGIRTMAKAVYSSDNIGHYGLGFKDYCHFTSPIRRYPDVMVHRILQQVLAGEKPNDKKMEKKCKHSSERERAAMECERAANKYKQVEYMSERLGEEFDAVVTGVSSFGFWAETVEHKCEGLVSVSYLNTFDDFRLVESDYQLVGLKSGRTFRMGDAVRIKVISANLSRRQLDYEWLPIAGAEVRSEGEKEVKSKKEKVKIEVREQPVSKKEKGKQKGKSKQEQAKEKSDINRANQLERNQQAKLEKQQPQPLPPTYEPVLTELISMGDPLISAVQEPIAEPIVATPVAPAKKKRTKPTTLAETEAKLQKAEAAIPVPAEPVAAPAKKVVKRAPAPAVTKQAKPVAKKAAPTKAATAPKKTAAPKSAKPATKAVTKTASKKTK